VCVGLQVSSHVFHGSERYRSRVRSGGTGGVPLCDRGPGRWPGPGFPPGRRKSAALSRPERARSRPFWACPSLSAAHSPPFHCFLVVVRPTGLRISGRNLLHVLMSSRCASFRTDLEHFLGFLGAQSASRCETWPFYLVNATKCVPCTENGHRGLENGHQQFENGESRALARCSKRDGKKGGYADHCGGPLDAACFA
jgi:hypothetical protein